MEDNVIVIINRDKIELQSNNPDLTSLINSIISQSDEYNFNEIIIECNNKDFDKDNFKKILVESITQFKENLRIEKKEYDKKIDSIESKRQEID